MSRHRRKLKARRKFLGYSQADIGAEVGVSEHTVRCWENGTRTPATPYRPDLARALDVSLHGLDILLELADEPEQDDALVFGPRLTMYEGLVQGAERLAIVETEGIPALFQTRRYATAIEQFNEIPQTAEQIDQRVDTRMARQSVLTRPDPLRLDVLITEAAVLAVVGGPEVMTEQLERVVALMTAPNIELRVLPTDGRHSLARGGFQLLTQPGGVRPYASVTFGAATGPAYTEEPQLLARRSTIWSYLVDGAKTTEQSAEYLQSIKETHLQ